MAGTFNEFPGGGDSTDCAQCWAGYYCLSDNLAGPTAQCPAGYICPEGTSDYTVQRSQAGYYAPIGSAQQFSCQPGTYSASQGLASCTNCEAGEKCSAFNLQAPLTCDKGYYCPERSYFTDRSLSYHEIPCPAGTLQNALNARSVDDCTPCAEGRYCPNNATLESAVDYCKEGYYCTVGSSVEQPVDLLENQGATYGYC